MRKKNKNKKKKTFYLKVRKNFVTGLITLLPLFVTYIFIAWLMKFLHKNLAFVPKLISPDNDILIILFEFVLFLLILLFIYIVGVFTNKYIGKKTILMGESLLNRIPLIRTIYTGTKQILNGLMVSNKKAFRKVVMVEYPRKGMWVLGFVTGEVYIYKRKRKVKMITIFIPSTPNPTTGFMIILPQKDVKVVNISSDNALKSIISGGVLTPKLYVDEY